MIQDNKAILRKKYDAATETADIIRGARKTIIDLKKDISNLRRERAVAELSSPASASEASLLEMEDSPQEVSIKNEIAIQKKVYKEACVRLKVLKEEVDRIQKLLLRNRETLQKDFNDWYASTGHKQDLTDVIMKHSESPSSQVSPFAVGQLSEERVRIKIVFYSYSLICI